jgi:hypothetical protein
LTIRAKGNAFGIVGWSIGCGTVSLAAPQMFTSLGPYAFFIFAAFNLIAVAMVYCFYPEVACRTLEEIDLLFASKTPFVWDEEKKFRELRAQHAELFASRIPEIDLKKEVDGTLAVEHAEEKV